LIPTIMIGLAFLETDCEKAGALPVAVTFGRE